MDVQQKKRMQFVSSARVLSLQIRIWQETLLFNAKNGLCGAIATALRQKVIILFDFFYEKIILISRSKLLKKKKNWK